MPQQGGAYNMHPAFGGFMNDPTAQLGFQMGKTAMDAGQQYMEQNVSCLLHTYISIHPLTPLSSVALSPSPHSNTTSTYLTHTSSPNSASSSSHGGTGPGRVNSVTTQIQLAAHLHPRSISPRAKT
jgi:hypothetical protein